MSIFLHGIPNCDTVKKAKNWLDEHNIEYQFVNFKKEGIDPKQVTEWIEKAGIETIINKRGTTWRKLSDEEKNVTNTEEAVALICANSSIVKRPVLVGEQLLKVGFKPEIYRDIFA